MGCGVLLVHGLCTKGRAEFHSARPYFTKKIRKAKREIVLDIDYADIWKKTLVELKMMMTKATFRTWLQGTQFLRYGDNGRFVVGVRNIYAKDWLESRLYDSVLQVLRHVGDDVLITGLLFEVAGAVVVSEGIERPLAVQFAGFEPYRSNFVQVPKQFFETVLCDGSYVMRIFVGFVISETYGVIMNMRTKERREWWEVSRDGIMRTTGIKSLVSVSKAIYEARNGGFVVREVGFSSYKYRPREEGEQVDVVVDN